MPVGPGSGTSLIISCTWCRIDVCVVPVQVNVHARAALEQAASIKYEVLWIPIKSSALYTIAFGGTGELLTSLAVAPENTLLEQFIIHPNGSKLLTKAIETIINEDETTTEVVHRYDINLSDYSFTEITDPTIDFEPSRYVQFSGRYFIVTQALEFADDSLQLLFREPNLTFLTPY